MITERSHVNINHGLHGLALKYRRSVSCIMCMSIWRRAWSAEPVPFLDYTSCASNNRTDLMQFMQHKINMDDQLRLIESQLISIIAVSSSFLINY